MIGVIAKRGEIPAVEEFFELFKTPWELCRPGRRYDVVVATTSDCPLIDARLVLLYGSDVKSSDGRGGFAIRARHHGVSLEVDGRALPVYGDALTFESGTSGAPCLDSTQGVAAVRLDSEERTVIRAGYDLFKEVHHLLTTGQPVAYAQVPTLDLHIKLLRDWILSAGVSFVEIPPVPAGHPFAVCLTHDIDFVGIRHHRFDHSMWGFVYRATVGALRNVVRRRLSIRSLLQGLRAVAALPFVYAGWVKDFWEPFEWYSRVERGLPATYFLIPFKRRAGERVPGAGRSRRATKYDVDDVREAVIKLKQAGCEIAVHGIDAWHNVERARQERARIADVMGSDAAGNRTHWLLQADETARVLDKAGYQYDASAGYNETVGFRQGTAQVVRPPGTEALLDLPLHIQDGALFFPQRLDLSEADAGAVCDRLIEAVSRAGGVLTVLWHDRSHAPERFWGEFYVRLLERLRAHNPWFGTAEHVVGWFRQRREIRFVDADVHHQGGEIRPPVVIRHHRPSTGTGHPSCVDTPWSGTGRMHLDECSPRLPHDEHAFVTCATP